MKIINLLKRIKANLRREALILQMAVLCIPKYKHINPVNRKRFVWFGAYGNTNIGDGLIFFALKKYLPSDAQIYLSCRERKPTTNFGVPTFYKDDKEKWKQLIKQGDWVLLGGGGLFEYYKESYHKAEFSILGYLMPLVYARLMGKTYAIIGMGCNNLRIPNRLTRYIFKRITSDAAFIITRDQKSAEGFKKNGTKNDKLISCYDPVFNLCPVKDRSRQQLNQKVAGFLLWPYYMWPYFHSTTNCADIHQKMNEESERKHKLFVENMQDSVHKLASQGITCRFLIFHFSDEVMLEEMGLKNKYHFPTIDNYFKSISECDIIISMRYHGQITALLYNKPLISISVQEKMDALVDNFNLKDYSIDIEDFESNKLINMIDKIYSNYELVVKEQNEKTIEKQRVVQQTYTKIFENSLDFD